MLMVQSLGDIPSEPLGGGSARELVLGLGRPLILFLLGLGIIAAGLWRLSGKLFADSAWTGRIFGNVAGVLLTVGAAGGLQRLCQETGMAELIGERLLGWHVGALGGLWSRSSWRRQSRPCRVRPWSRPSPPRAWFSRSSCRSESAARTAKALAALAIGAGAMTAAHVNDEYFWLVADRAGLSSLGALARISAGTLLQGLITVMALIALSLVVS